MSCCLPHRRAPLPLLLVLPLLGSPCLAQPAAAPESHGHQHHSHSVGPAGATYDLRWLDAMQQHHTGALRMSERVFNGASPGVGALARQIWRDQAQEIREMILWRRAWYPQAPVYPVVLRPGGDPDNLSGLARMDAAQREALRMAGPPPPGSDSTIAFHEGMLQHHGGALAMAHEALNRSPNSTIRRLARSIVIEQRREIIELRGMLHHSGLNKPEYHHFDSLFRF